SDYPEILKDMIVEGIKALDGKSFLVMVDRADFSIMEKEVLPAVRDELKGELEDVRIRQLEEDSLGGVKVGTPGGNVVYDNRFEARMYRLRDDIRNMIYEDIFRSEGGEG
ncbi:MAG TPA: V-type ATP synthase subunit E family protein, partial [Candidatus Krumholzibacteriaceae bacterium]|nr:V-type ATP synthase subunit E family protein [Candidatus Krumholzibacteriaceae bacterium]